jgi:hypothetical protein
MDSLEPIKRKICEIRRRRVMLDSDHAGLYQIETQKLKRSVLANIERFPDDFMFELTKEEYDSLRCNNSKCIRSYKETPTAVAGVELRLKSLVVKSLSLVSGRKFKKQ